jgi:pyrimidine operon attenuation protein/uracil phosphoribosyltransferase
MRKVLDEKGIDVIVLRMANQVYEQFCDFKELVILGIEGEGFVLSKMLKIQLEKKNGMKCHLYQLNLKKHKSRKPEISFTPPLPDLKGIPVLVVDDVLNSGRTLTYCISSMVDFEIPSMRIAVLVERLYRTFPVSSSITGIELSTTFEENVIAVLNPENGEVGVFLS